MSIFQFKQFTIYQDLAGMKVGTDSIILGSAIKIKSEYKRVIDVGTGTGLLSLMIAQKSSNSDITAVEIDSNAYHQAKINIDKCKWRNRINLIHTDAKQLEIDHKYDLIICNPPYFSNSKQSVIISKNTARHQVELTFKDLLNIWDKIGNDDSDLACIIPIIESEKLYKMVKNHGNYLAYYLEVRSNPNSYPKRAVMQFSKNKMETIQSELCIHNNEGGYSEAYIKMTKDFYLNH
tara:strand:+ start:404 stop:1108 length:705 start_codon:yes stop_codon:yes gene_type:complete